ncbi:MAG TPA: hypothetical protein VFW05_15655 [Verrucomicrobiae bacterium]|jgi:hypothetical protein|nr:hypothetical protein [Verrucomicrobiae bacterium]
MMRGANTLVFLLGLSFCVVAHAASPDSAGSPYQAIVERNVFGLKPPAPAEEAPPPPEPPSKITLSGITTMLGNKRALLSVQVLNKPPENFILAEGQRDGDIEVLQIDEIAGTVKVSNHGVEQLLDFKTDGAKLHPTAVAPPHPAPAAARPPGVPPPPTRTIPTRTLRIPSIPQPAH